MSGVAATLDEAIKLRTEFKERAKGFHRSGSSAAALGPLFLETRRPDDTSRWQRHVAIAGWARKPVADVTTADGRDWLCVLSATRVRWGTDALGWQTRKHCLLLARAFFAWTLRKALYGVMANPFAGISIPSAPLAERVNVVYFIQPRDGGRIKIGTTRNLKQRLADLNLASPIELIVRGTVRGGKELERKLHERFDSFRAHSEWFEPDQSILDWIASNANA